MKLKLNRRTEKETIKEKLNKYFFFCIVNLAFYFYINELKDRERKMYFY